jgi:hypothetical protein
VFRFPRDAKRLDLWKRKIPRENLVVSQHTRICIQHFEERFINRYFEYRGADGLLHRDPRDVPVLTDDAYPTIFSNLPEYLSEKLPVQRKDPDKRRREIDDRSEAAVEIFLTADLITDYEVFKSEIAERIASQRDWHVVTGDSLCLLYILDTDSDIPSLNVSVEVTSDMCVRVFLKHRELLQSELAWILDQSLTLKRWSQLENILGRYCSIDYPGNLNSSTCDVIANVCDTLKTLCDRETADDDVNINSVKFCCEQLQLSSVVPCRRRYSCDMLRFAFLLHTRSPACYRILYDMGKIILPHPSTLRKLSAVFNVNPGLEAEAHERYVRLRASQLTEKERVVVLQLDEIHVNAGLTYKSGGITGAAVNADNQVAHSVQAFMVSSIFGSMKEIVALCPVKDLKSGNLLEMLQKVLNLLQTNGFTVVCVAADNNQLNAKAFADFAGKEPLEKGVPNPNHPGKLIFFLFDTVHILKCVRNNWINQLDNNQTFNYPPIPEALQQTAALVNNSPANAKPSALNTADSSAVVNSFASAPAAAVRLQASFSSLKDVYESERNSTIRKAFKLTYKSLFPTNLERQQVALVLNVFHESTVAALLCKGTEQALNTAEFVRLIVAWWRIVNVKHTLKGLRKRDALSKPIVNVDDDRLLFLERFATWLQQWGSGKGCLTSQTLRALTHTSVTIVHLVKYLFANFSVKYVLVGKLQTDNLERRFGEYRQMSGGNYNVSVLQVLEAEKKLRLSTALALRSKKMGHIVIKDIKDALMTDEPDLASGVIPEQFLLVASEVTEACFSCDEASMVYITGFVVHKVIRLLRCRTCKTLVQNDRDLHIDKDDAMTASLDISYVSCVDRGGLKYPTVAAVLVGYKVFSVIQVLVSERYEQDFLKLTNQKSIALSIVLDALTSDDYFHSEMSGICSVCQKPNRELIKLMIPRFLNVFLNNYTRKCNDVIAARGGKKRKLQTLV